MNDLEFWVMFYTNFIHEKISIHDKQIKKITKLAMDYKISLETLLDMLAAFTYVSELYPDKKDSLNYLCKVIFNKKETSSKEKVCSSIPSQETPLH